METRTVKKSVIINAHAADVWKMITDPERIKQWFFGTNVETDWKKGSPIRYYGLWKGKEYSDKGKILESEENKKLVHTHWSSLSDLEDKPENYYTVSYEIDEKESETVLCVTQTGLMSKDTFDHSAQNW